MKKPSEDTLSRMKRRVMFVAATLTAIATAGNDAFACTQYFLYNVARYERISGRVTLLYSALSVADERQVCMDVIEAVERQRAPRTDECGCLKLPVSLADSSLLGKFITFKSGGALLISQ